MFRQRYSYHPDSILQNMDRIFSKPQMINPNHCMKSMKSHTLNESTGKTAISTTVYDRTSEEPTPNEIYLTMRQDEDRQLHLRKYDPYISHTEEITNVFKFYFKEASQKLQQRKQTCHLAMTYFTETIMR